MGRRKQEYYTVITLINLARTLHYEEAIIYESDAYGDDITIKQINDKVNSEEDYVSRQNFGWILVALTGRVNVFKGQIMDSRWIKYCDVNDEIETWILR